MPVDRRMLPAFLDGDATFRTWAQGVDAQLKACGMVQTSDTGQVDLSTAIRPASSSYAGYRIYRFDDSLQATHPVFMKLEYGVATVQDRPAFRIQTATATNGAGNLLGQISSLRSVSASAGSTLGTTLDSFCSGSASGGRIALFTNCNSAQGNYTLGLILERVRDGNGLPVDRGVFFATTTSSQISWQVIQFSGAVPSVNTNYPGLSASFTGWFSADGADVALLPVLTIAKARPGFLTFLTYKNSDIAQWASFTATHYGASHSFMPMGNAMNAMGSSDSIAILWE
jgi:hypothetical protein